MVLLVWFMNSKSWFIWRLLWTDKIGQQRKCGKGHSQTGLVRLEVDKDPSFLRSLGPFVWGFRWQHSHVFKAPVSFNPTKQACMCLKTKSLRKAFSNFSLVKDPASICMWAPYGPKVGW